MSVGHFLIVILVDILNWQIFLGKHFEHSKLEITAFKIIKYSFPLFHQSFMFPFGFLSHTNLSFMEHSISVRENLHSRSGSQTMAKQLPVIQSPHLSAELSTSSPPVHFQMSLSTIPPTKKETCSYGSKSN